MHNDKITPEFAILGHPNEGKSSVLSTLAEDDSVRISPTPGETRECRTFPVIIDGQEILRFVDTPGFQNPRRVLKGLQDMQGDSLEMFHIFLKKHESIPEFADDCELLRPIVKGAGIIYVVDASRPLRNVDTAEMEILRLTGKPRMAVMNCKEHDTEYLSLWKNELRKNFNSYRLFNAHRATYAERILLLESLKNIDQDWHSTLATIVETFKKDWESRNQRTAEIVCDMLFTCLSYNVKKAAPKNSNEEDIKKQLFNSYQQTLKKTERDTHKRIRVLFKHNIFNYSLPSYSLLHDDLFDDRTWEFLGLERKQMAVIGGLGGAALAATLDLAVGGVSLGLFTTMGGAFGAMGALYGSKRLSESAQVLGIGLGSRKIQIGPHKDIQLLFILLDRAFLYYSHIINWAHGRRDYSGCTSEKSAQLIQPHPQSFTNSWSVASLKICHDFFKAVTNGNQNKIETAQKRLKELIRSTLLEISLRE